MKVGITQCAVGNMPAEDFIAEGGRNGYEVVELCLRREGSLTPQSDAAQIAALKRRASDAEVGIFSIGLMHLTATPLDRDEAQAKAIEEINAGLRLAKAIGAGHVLLTLGRLRPDLYYDEAYKNGVESLRRVAPTAEELGVDIAVEFVWNGFLFSPLEMKRFLDDVGHPRVGFYFDPGNMAVFQYPHHWLRILGKHTKLVHLKDWKGNALSGGWTPLLEGAVDFREVMKELRAIGYDGPLTSEVEPSLAPLDKTAQAIRRIMAL
jgi:L-ribulose-5-phosphate 3-epimerase